MTDKEKIRAEISRLIKEYEDMLNPSDKETIGGYTLSGIGISSKIEVLTSIRDFIESLPEEPVSEGLEEAAIKAAMTDMCDRQVMECSSDERLCYSRIFRRGFKDGAQWQKEQMAKDAIDADVNTYECVGESSYVEFVANLPVSQFRKDDKVKLIIIKEEEK